MEDHAYNQDVRTPILDHSPSLRYDGCVLLLWLGVTCVQRVLIRRFLVPRGMSQHDTWKWKKVVFSQLNVSVLGLGAAWCLYDEPDLLTDQVTIHTKGTRTLVAMGVAYMTNDIFAMISDNQYSERSFCRYMSHHVSTFAVGGATILTRSCMGGVTIGILSEINTIFVNARYLLQCAGSKRTGVAFRVNNWLVLGTLISFRVVPAYWLWSALITHYVNHVPLPMVILVGMTLTVVCKETYTVLKQSIQFITQSGIESTYGN